MRWRQEHKCEELREVDDDEAKRWKNDAVKMKTSVKRKRCIARKSTVEMRSNGECEEFTRVKLKRQNSLSENKNTVEYSNGERKTEIEGV